MRNWVRVGKLWLRNLFRSGRKQRDLDREMAFHLQMAEEENLSNGMSPEEARREALREFGAREQYKEEARDAWGHGVLLSLWRDFRYAFRSLIRSPGFFASTVSTLALCIGACLVFGAISNTALFRPLGFPDSERLVWIQGIHVESGAKDSRVSILELEAVREMDSFSSIATIASPSAIWEHDDGFETVPSITVSRELAGVLGIEPSLGRLFQLEDSYESAEDVALIGYEFWQSRFNRDPKIIDTMVRLNGRSHRVIGVLPLGLEFPLERAPALGTGEQARAGAQAFWLPSRYRPKTEKAKKWRSSLAIARLDQDTDIASVNTELAVISARLEVDFPDSNRGLRLKAIRVRDQILGPMHGGILTMMYAVGALMCIGIINTICLFIVRSLARREEIATRLAVGASRWRIFQMSFTESLVVGFTGSVAGLILAYLGIAGIQAFSGSALPFMDEASIDFGILVLAVALFALVSTIIAIPSAVNGLRRELGSYSRATLSPRTIRVQNVLMVLQIAGVFALLSLSGATIASYKNLLNQDLGYEDESVIFVDTAVPHSNSNAYAKSVYMEAVHVLENLPGVESVGLAQSTPLVPKWVFQDKLLRVGESNPASGIPNFEGMFVAYDYFEAMGIELLRGRVFDARNSGERDHRQVIILNEAAANTIFGAENPIGRKIVSANNPERVFTVLGVVENTRDENLTTEAKPRYYLNVIFNGANFVAQVVGDSRKMKSLVSEELEKMRSRLVVNNISTISETIDDKLAARKFIAIALSAFAMLSFAIGSIGVFGVLDYQLVQRTKEFGIRLALGSTAQELAIGIGKQLMRVLFLGGLLGFLGVLLTRPIVSSQMYGISSVDPSILGLSGLAVFLVSAAAWWLASRRALQDDVVRALRVDR